MPNISLTMLGGKEPTTIQDIKNYKSKQHSTSNSQILFEDYSYQNAFVVMKEMVDQNVLTLTEKHLVTKQISLMIGYSKDCIKPSCGWCDCVKTTFNVLKIVPEHLAY